MSILWENKESKQVPLPNNPQRRIRRFNPVHARTMNGECSAACVENDAGDFVTHADYAERIAASVAWGAELERNFDALSLKYAAMAEINGDLMDQLAASESKVTAFKDDNTKLIEDNHLMSENYMDLEVKYKVKLHDIERLESQLATLRRPVNDEECIKFGTYVDDHHPGTRFTPKQINAMLAAREASDDK